ncbi:MAG: 50S ribosomal protein L11 [Thermoplasmata archaeon]|nr:50S ribosomal protein L11 [Thermoplasmata archaeon]
MAEVIDALVEGGKASAGPPLGPALGPLGVNISEIVKRINEKTADFEGIKVPVKVTVDPVTKKFDITVGTPPVSALIMKELGLDKGSDNPRTRKVGNLTIEQIKNIARIKKDSLLGADVRGRVKEIAGSCVAMGVTVEGMDPRDFQRDLESGKIKLE